MNTENTQIPKLNVKREKVKEPINWSKVRTMMIVGLLAIGSAWCTTNYLYEKSQEWNSKHGFQSPVIFRSPIYNKQTKQPKKVSEVIVKPVEAKVPFCRTAIDCIRDVGNELGKSNREISVMINIARAESNFNPKAKNKTSTASGIYQIIAGTWYSNNCVGDKFNYEDNIRCGYKILDNQGTPAWEVCKTSVNCSLK